MIDDFKFKSVPQENFIMLKVDDRSFYFGELTYQNDHNEESHLFPSNPNMEEILQNQKLQKDRNGFGVQIFLNQNGEVQSKMEGLWIKNKLHGTCKILYPDGSEYQGKIINDSREGFGKLKFPDEKSYHGFWHNDCMEGPGVFQSEDKQLQGNFVNNLYITSSNYLLNPFENCDLTLVNAKQQQTAAQIREFNIHLKNYRILETYSAEKAVEFSQASFKNDRYCFTVAEINSPWNFAGILRVLSGHPRVIIDCQKVEFLAKNDKIGLEQYMATTQDNLKKILVEGGLIIVNVDEPSRADFRKDLDVDFKALVSANRLISILFNVKNLKLAPNFSEFFQIERVSANCGILFYSKWRMPNGLSQANVRQQILNRFQYICNVHWGDVLVFK